MDNIWYDSEALNGRGLPSDYVGESDVNLGPRNKRDNPCDGCSSKQTCMQEFLECQAFRVWCEKGNYSDDQIAVSLTSIQEQ